MESKKLSFSAVLQIANVVDPENKNELLPRIAGKSKGQIDRILAEYQIPFARGGPSTVNNLRLLCAKHNKHTAEQTYGKAHVEKFFIKEPPVAYPAGASLFHN